MPNSHNLPPVSESSLLSADHLMDVAHSMPLLADHGAGIGRGSRLEVLAPSSSPFYVDHGRPLHGLILGCGEPCSSAPSSHAEPACPASGLLPGKPCSSNSTGPAPPASGSLHATEPVDRVSTLAPVPMHGSTAPARELADCVAGSSAPMHGTPAPGRVSFDRAAVSSAREDTAPSTPVHDSAAAPDSDFLSMSPAARTGPSISSTMVSHVPSEATPSSSLVPPPPPPPPTGPITRHRLGIHQPKKAY
jgi:hypothetical protein